MTRVHDIYGLCCPACRSDDCLQVVIECWADLSEDGTEPLGDHEWDHNSPCRCANCGFHSAVVLFRADNGEVLS